MKNEIVNNKLLEQSVNEIGENEIKAIKHWPKSTHEIGVSESNKLFEAQTCK